ncbi:MAG: hypothetical protein CM1200mP12_12300 [Gammaproteobacteria bacterium]|nr:MAG: hypothetical protein CM1200mP12_12300 [Gammaproteobacteria bacterium]
MKIDAGIPTNDPRESGKATKVLEDAGYEVRLLPKPRMIHFYPS